MKALVTGGAGFIGSHLAEMLCRQGASVVVLDNLHTGKLSNLNWRRPGDRLQFVEADITDLSAIERAVAGCDCVFHQAALASIPMSVAEPLKANDVNLTGTLNLLIAAKAAHVRRFVFASSCSVYGELPPHLVGEDSPETPSSPYALQKLASEKYCRLFTALNGFETVGLRYFNVFGPRQSFDSPYSGVIAKFCAALVRGGQPVIYGDGQQSRDFVYVDDVVRANLLAAEAPASKVAGKVFNIGSGRSTTIRQLLERLCAIVGDPVQPRFEPARSGDVRRSRADLSLAKESLGYTAGTSFEEGLRRTFGFYRVAESQFGRGSSVSEAIVAGASATSEWSG